MDREFDIVTFGAAGYVGRLVAEALARAPASALCWAMAGRDMDRLRGAREAVGAGEEVALVRADADDSASLASLAERAGVVLTTVGPYQKHGSGLVAACVAAGTGYVDLNGEPLWMRDMIERHERAARASGARIVFSCGYDSIPYECGVMALQRLCVARWSHPAPRVGARVLGTKGGGFSGSTTASLRGNRERAEGDVAQQALLDDPFALTPGFRGPAQPDFTGACEDPLTGRWVAPHVMAPINVKNVHRGNLLAGFPNGRDFRYDEAVVAPGEGAEAKAAAERVAGTDRIGRTGEGDPDALSRKPERPADGFFRILFVAHHPERGRLALTVAGDADPGYGSTSRMVAAAARCLALDGPWRPGIWTPGALMADKLVAPGERGRAELRGGAIAVMLTISIGCTARPTVASDAGPTPCNDESKGN